MWSIQWRRNIIPRAIVSRAIVLCLALSWGLTSWAAEPRFRFTQQAEALVIELDGRAVARYVFRDPQIHRPYFDRVRTVSGLEVTRPNPPREGVDPTDHVGLHTGLWLSFGDLNGHDYWRLKARTEHAEFVEEPFAVDGEARFAVRNRYLSTQGDEVVCTEVCRYTVRTCQGGWLLAADSEFRPEGTELVFGDQEELGWGVRVATPLVVDRAMGGRMLDSEGRRNGRQIWGQQVAWCDYAGPLEGRWVGLQDPASRQAILNDMERVLGFVEKLNEVDTKGVEPLIFMTDEVDVLREDVVVPGDIVPKADALKNSPVKDSDYFKVPRVVDKG